jgi:hypothetical protein
VASRERLRKRFSPAVNGHRNYSFCEDGLTSELLVRPCNSSSAADATILEMLAASANASDDAVDVRGFLIKDGLRSRRRFGNVGRNWLVVTYWR